MNIRSVASSFIVDVGRFFVTNLSTFSYLFVCLNAIFFGYILVTEPNIRQTIYSLTNEDSYVEHFTAIFFFLAGLLLVIVISTERRIFPRCIYVLGFVAFMFIAGEEISWGQRIFDFETPDIVMETNRQNEFTLHNIKIEDYYLNKIFSRIYIYGTLVFCMIICAAFFCNKNVFMGIPFPSIPLMLSLLVMLSHKSPHNHNLYFFPIYPTQIGLLLIFIMYTLFSKRINLAIYAIATMILVLVIPYLYHHDNSYLFRGEIREFLFSFCCFIYSLELLQAQGYGPFKSNARSESPSMLSRNYLVYVATIVFTISGSFYLVSLKIDSSIPLSQHHLSQHQQETLRFLNDADPVIRSNFDVYLKDESLIYVREGCDSQDTYITFFLHIVPSSQSDLPHFSKQHGFHNLDFNFEPDGFFVDQRCIVVRYLPGYEIAKITTGQSISNLRKGTVTFTEIWKGTFQNVP